MSDVYYFISDLHIGGDEQLQHVAFEDELLDFLRELEATDEDAELIVNGDAFGLWEFTELDGMAKFDALVERYPDLFEQFRATGEQIPITFIPGNHDYELAVYPEYVERLAEYNVTLEQEIAITRAVGERVIYVEHGMQRDPNNRIPDFGNPYANPIGYFVNRYVTSRAGKLSGRGRANWLRDIQAVTPMTLIPEWMISNYFYREMSPLLRYASVPFLLLFNVALLYVGLFLLYAVGIWRAPLELFEDALLRFGLLGVLVEVLLIVNMVVIFLLALVAVPLVVFGRDLRKTLRRFGFLTPSAHEESTDKYVEGARDIFAADPNVAVFVYGHTHRASLTEVDDRVVINTGTWLKRLHREEPFLGLLPAVFYSSYLLNYFRITAGADEADRTKSEGQSAGEVVVEYHVIDKPDPRELTLLERLLTRKPRRREKRRQARQIPERTVVGGTVESAEHLVDD